MKKLYLVFLISLCSFLISGCWNYRELNDLAIVSAIGIEKKDENFYLTIQIMSAKKEGSESSGSASTPITIITSTGKTTHEAFRRATLKSPQTFYIGHTNLVVIGEGVAKDGLNNAIDFLIRDPESRKQFAVMIAKDDKIKDILGVLTPIEKFPALDITEGLKVVSNKYGATTFITFDELVSFIYAEGLEPVIPELSMIGDAEEGSSPEDSNSTIPKANIITKGLGVFNDDKLLGYLNEINSIGYNMITNNIDETVISVKCNANNYMAMEVFELKSKLKIILEPKLKVKISTKVISNFSESNCKVNLLNAKEREELKLIFKNRIESIMSSSIDYVQKNYASDIFGFGRAIYKKDFKYWNNIKHDWGNIFPNLDYEIDVDIEFIRKGSAIQSIKEEMDESKKR